MVIRAAAVAIAAALLVGGCSGGDGGSAPGSSVAGGDPGAGWMDDAVVQVAIDTRAAREVVTLSGPGPDDRLVADEPYDPDAAEEESP